MFRKTTVKEPEMKLGSRMLFYMNITSTAYFPVKHLFM